jgi:hypothetical protein
MDRLLMLAIAIVIAGALSGGVYSIAGSGTGNSVVINRFTGKVWTCNLIACDPLEFRISK